MKQKHLTVDEMVQQYPDQWLFIVDCKHSASTELISGIVAVHSPSRDVIKKASAKYKGARLYAIQVNRQKGDYTFCNAKDSLSACI